MFCFFPKYASSSVIDKSYLKSEPLLFELRPLELLLPPPPKSPKKSSKISEKSAPLNPPNPPNPPWPPPPFSKAACPKLS